jgi:hypothetical protein
LYPQPTANAKRYTKGTAIRNNKERGVFAFEVRTLDAERRRLVAAGQHGLAVPDTEDVARKLTWAVRGLPESATETEK